MFPAWSKPGAWFALGLGLLGMWVWFPEAVAYPLSPILTNPLTGRQYLLLHVSTWTEAEQWARSMGGHLATVRNQAEQDWIYNTFASYGGFSKLLWIGLNDRAQEERFIWVDGDPAFFSHWAQGEPNQAGSEDYVAMYYPGHSQQSSWNDWADRRTDPIGIPFHGVVELLPSVVHLLVPAGAAWKYHDRGQNLESQWRAADYDDASWPSGPAPLGYGDGDEATVLSFGSDPNNKPITAYFRHRFTVDDRDRLRGLVLSVLRDDGAVVYLNGLEVARHNLPEGEIAYDTPALSGVPVGDESSHFHSSFLDPGMLVDGPNLLAVEIHQVLPTSQDISFNLQLLASENLPPAVNMLAPRLGQFVGVPQSLQLHAVAEDDQEVAQVALFRAGDQVDTTNAPVLFSTISHARGGLSKFLAVATDNDGLSTTSAPVTLRFYPGLVPGGSAWRYWDLGTDLGSAWRQSAFEDGSWAMGPAPLGYGDGDEATTVGYGPDPNNKSITTYFRKSFTVSDPSEFSRLILRLIRDDGAVVYLNAVEVGRLNLPVGEDILYSTLALNSVTGADEIRLYDLPVSLDLLRAGQNQLAVELHQSNPASSDLRFDLELIAVPMPRVPVLSLSRSGGLSWSLADAGYGLETTDSLAPAAEWVPFDGPVLLIDGQLQVHSDLEEPRRFFRLKAY